MSYASPAGVAATVASRTAIASRSAASARTSAAVGRAEAREVPKDGDLVGRRSAGVGRVEDLGGRVEVPGPALQRGCAASPAGRRSFRAVPGAR